MLSPRDVVVLPVHDRLVFDARARLGALAGGSQRFRLVDRVGHDGQAHGDANCGRSGPVYALLATTPHSQPSPGTRQMYS